MLNRALAFAFILIGLMGCESTPSQNLPPLHQAAIEGASSKLANILSQPNFVDIDLVDGTGHTALMAAINQQQYAAAQILIDNGANIHRQNRQGKTALVLLASHQKPPLSLIKSLFDINTRLNAAYDDKTLVEVFRTSDSLFEPNKTYIVEFLETAAADLMAKRTEIMVEMDGDEFPVTSAYAAEGGDLNFEDDSFYTPLMKATNIGNLTAMAFLLDNGADANYKDSKYGETAIFETLSGSDTQALDLLLSKGADINTPIGNGVTYLMRAVSWNNIDMVRNALELGADLNATSNSGWTPLHWTVNSKDNQDFDATEIAQFLILSGAKINVRTDDGYTPINLATANVHLGVFNLLLDAGADLNIASKDKYSPLINALYYDQYEMVVKLINAGADVNQIGDEDWAPLLWAVNNEENQSHDGTRYIKLLLENGANINVVNDSGNTAVKLAAMNQRENELTALLSFGADVNIANELGHTALMSAVSNNHLLIAKKLLVAGADIHKAENDGWAPIHWSVNSKQELPDETTEMVALLIEHGANVNQQENRGNTPLRLAAANERIGELKRLLKAGADPNIQNEDGLFPLISAISKNQFDMAEFLLSSGANPNLVDNDGWASLHWTSNNKEYQKHSGLKFAELLLANNAKVNLQSKDGITPLNLAVLNGHSDVFERLFKAGGDINLATNDGYSPVIHAVAKNNLPVLKTLINAGADLTQATTNGWQPIHFTVNQEEYQKHDASELLTLLIEAGSDVNSRINAGHTALMLAAVNGRYDEAKILLENGANLKTVNKKNGSRTALDYAALMGYRNLVSLLKKYKSTTTSY